VITEDVWTRQLVGTLWSGQYNMPLSKTWERLPALGINWVWLSDLCLRVSQEGIQRPLLVNVDEAKPRLVQGHHRFWVACMLNLPVLPVKPPQFTLLTSASCV
jgi:hypothetical protein